MGKTVIPARFLGSSTGGRHRWFRLRWVLPLVVLACTLVAFQFDVSLSQRPKAADASFPTQLYYALGFFVFGGLDLGMPIGGSSLGRGLMWLCYFSAPAITASAVVEGILRAIGRRGWALRRLRGHVVIAGCGALTMQYLSRLRASHPARQLVIVESRADHPNLEEARQHYGADVIIGDIASEVVLGALRLEHASRVLLLTGDDFVNLDAAATMLTMVSNLGQRVVVHVSNLRFMQSVSSTRLGAKLTIFNTHQIAAEHLVESKLLGHFRHTTPLDTVVIAGFGRFGQTVLAELQERASGKFEAVILIDLECAQRAKIFDEQIGFEDSYEHRCVDGDLRDPEVWQQIERSLGDTTTEPTFIIGSGDDGTNLRTALWLRAKFPDAYIVARGFRRSAFARDLSRECGFEVFSVAELVHQSIPDSWLA